MGTLQNVLFLDVLYSMVLSVGTVYLLMVILTTFIMGKPLMYGKVYKQLPNMTFVRNYEQVYDSEGLGFVWFTNNKDFRLPGKEPTYLHNILIIKLFNPYGEWWRIKYLKWFEENIDIKNLVEYNWSIHERNKSYFFN